MESSDRLMTLPEVGAFLGGRSVKTVRRYIQQGLLPQAVRVNRSLMLWGSEVRRCLESMRVNQTGGRA